MTEIEEKFYKVFEIEPKYACNSLHSKELESECNNNDYFKCKICRHSKKEYPQITSDILLKLICILNQHYCNNYQCATMLVGSTVDEVKRCVLVECLENATHIKTEVRALFEEGAEDV